MDTTIFNLANDVSLTMIHIGSGRFTMGSTSGLPLELPLREVTISQPFLLGKFPITQAQWCAVMGSNPAEFHADPQLPVENVSWLDCMDFCDKLTQLLQRPVRLPSEAEWEYACRAGSTTEYYFGDDVAGLIQHAWFDHNSQDHTHPVGLKHANAWGLHDMVGNVWEWCADVWDSSYEGASGQQAARNDHADTQPRRILRGGSWNYDGYRCRSAYRSREWNEFKCHHFGLRVAMTV